VGATVSRGAGVPQSGPAGLLGDFRSRLYECLTTRRDALFGLADAALCEDRPVRDLARLSLAPEAGRGHGGLYDGLAAGRVDVTRLRAAVGRFRCRRGRTGGSGWPST
jgi:hypothetical protein